MKIRFGKRPWSGLGMLMVVMFATGVRADAFDAWTYHADLTFSGYEGTTELTNFPVLVRLDSIPEFAYSQLADPDGGGDLRFSVLGGDEELPYEIDTWNPDGASYVWVRVPSLSGRETAIRAYWGNAAVSTPPPAYTSDGSTWANGYAAVYHFNESSGMLLDSTAYANNSTNVLGDILRRQPGAVGSAYHFDGSGDYIAIPDSETLDGMTALTLEVWELDEATNKKTRTFLSKRESNATGKRSYYFFLENGRNLYVYVNDKGGEFKSSAPAADGWHHAAVTFDAAPNSNEMKAYTDGTFKNQMGNGATNVVDRDDPLLIGRIPGNKDADWMGLLDEIRISYVARSADWLKASWQTVAANAEFCTYGVAVNTRLPLGLTDAATDITTTGATLNGTLLEAPFATTVTVFWGHTDGGSDPNVWTFNHTFEPYDGDLPAAFSYAVTELAADSVWYVRHRLVNSAGEYWTRDADSFINGGVAVTATAAPAAEEGLVPGEFTFTRPEGTETCDTVVAYTVTGTATADEDYVALSGSVTIPAGKLRASVAVVPLWDYAVEGPETVRVELLPGAYAFGASTSAELNILDCPPPSTGTTNVWVGAGSASTPENWSLGHVPTASEDILLTGYSVSNMTWDAGVNGLTTNVASWTQGADFTGAVDLSAAFDAEAPALVVDGDAVIDGGTWTSTGRTDTETTKLYVRVCGGLTIGPDGAISVTGQGFKETSGPGYVGKAKGAAYGGEASGIDTWSKTYGSVFHPDRWGSGGGDKDHKFYGGGLLQLEVVGVLTVDGQIAADGTGKYNSRGAGSGGSIQIAAASLTGSGSVHADGATDTYEGSGGGGRVAIYLTQEDAAASDFLGSATAYGKKGRDVSSGKDCDTGCGTVYWQLAKEMAGGGTVWVSNPLYDIGKDMERRSCQLPAAQGPVEDYKKSSWLLQKNGQLKLTDEVRVRSIEIEPGSGKEAATLNLNGHTLRTRRLVILGTEYSPGVYEASDLPEGRVIGEGQVEVWDGGLLLFIR